MYIDDIQTERIYWQSPYQMLCHLHCNWSDLLTIFTDHLLNDIGEIIILRLPDDVQECLHHWPDEGGDVFFGWGGGEKVYLHIYWKMTNY